MLLAVTLGSSIIFLLLEMIGFASAVQNPMNLGKFTYKKQRLILCIVNIAFTLCILIVFLINSEFDMIVRIVFFCQVIVGFVYIGTLNIICRRKHLSDIKEEIFKLNLDINVDLIILRRQLMEQSDIFCSIKELNKVVNVLSQNK